MKVSVKQLFAICEIVLAVLALVLLFAPVLKIELYGVNFDWNGYEVFFGTGKVAGEKAFDVSVCGIITIVLLVVAIVAAVLKFVLKGKNLILNIVLLVSAVVAGILLFMTCTPVMTNFNGVKFNDIKDYLDLGVGAILGGIFAVLAGAAACVEQFLLKD